MSSHEPPRKRQKCSGDGDDQKVAEIIAYGGPMYDEATARKMLQEVVLVPVAYAQNESELMVRFDPNDATLDNLYYADDGNFGGYEITPMIYFADKGDPKMCRYLISRGASTTKRSARSEQDLFPMYTAAAKGNLDVCKLLYANGAQNDVRGADPDGYAPFHVAVTVTARSHEQDEVLRWLTLHGALCADANSERFEGNRIYPIDIRLQNDKKEISTSCQGLVEWAKEVTQTHSSLVAFLHGALPPAPNQDQSRTLQCLSGHPGVRQHIGDFVGLEVTKRKQLRILRNVVDTLPKLLVSS